MDARGVAEQFQAFVDHIREVNVRDPDGHVEGAARFAQILIDTIGDEYLSEFGRKPWFAEECDWIRRCLRDWQCHRAWIGQPDQAACPCDECKRQRKRS